MTREVNFSSAMILILLYTVSVEFGNLGDFNFVTEKYINTQENNFLFLACV